MRLVPLLFGPRTVRLVVDDLDIDEPIGENTDDNRHDSGEHPEAVLRKKLFHRVTLGVMPE
jgi:hypothetical protein